MEPTINYLAGQYALDVLSRTGPLSDNAKEFHDGIEDALFNAGFFVRREAFCSQREYGVAIGYIDLLAQYDGGFVALELDNRSPRSKSMDKLRAFSAFRIIVLRGDRRWGKERDIDAIVSVPVHE